MKIVNDLVSSNNRNIPFTLYKQDNRTDSLTIILPGTGYTTQKPLLYFSTSASLQKGFDVLQVNYEYSKEELSLLSEQEFTADVIAVIEPILKNERYSKINIIAKSIGTIALTYLLDNLIFETAMTIWLTPLLQRDDVFNALLNSSNKGLLIIGDRDHCYIEERYKELKSNNNISLKLIEGVNHSLEFEGNIFNSIDALKKVINLIYEFE
ncbi:alpha/beta hydrolase [Neobacillus sp. LXY-1]|uniref:alpha/beta hydrolase n=1 Tax=Neobacillus sp. LXY-1 TaxID=3379133 RepID=UPI003EE34404